MSPTLPPIVFADANVLYASAPRDILIELDLAGVISLRWSSTVLDELIRALVRTRPDYTAEKGLRLVAAMTSALPDALVTPPEATLTPDTLPDPNDVHVLQAAIHASCEAILTFNVRDFPPDRLAAYAPLMAVHPDLFLLRLLTTRAPAVLDTIETVRQNLTAQPMSVPEYTANLARCGLPQTAELLAHLLQA